MAEISAVVNDDFSKMTAQQMKNSTGTMTEDEAKQKAAEMGISSDAEARLLGYDEGLKALYDDIINSARDAQTAWKETVTVHSTAVQTAMTDMADLSDVSFGTIQNYGTMLEKLD
jgi:hypothetical protein